MWSCVGACLICTVWGNTGLEFAALQSLAYAGDSLGEALFPRSFDRRSSSDRPLVRPAVSVVKIAGVPMVQFERALPARNRERSPVRTTCLLLMLVAWVGGCSPSPVRVHVEPSHALTPEWEERASGLLVGALNPDVPFDGAWFGHRGQANDLFDRAGRSDSVRVRRRITPEPDGGLRIEFTDVESESVLVRTNLSQGDEGDWAVERSLASGIESAFSPPALFLPSRLFPGVPATRSFEVTSTGRGIPKNPGEGTATVLAHGAQRVSTDAGVFEAYVLSANLDFRIGPARMRFDQRLWIDMGPGRLGIVASERIDSVKVFGVSFLNERTVSVLAVRGESDP